MGRKRKFRFRLYADFKNSLNLKCDVPELPKPLNFGDIRKDGRLRTSPLSWHIPEAIAINYNTTLAQLTRGEVATHDGIPLTTNGKSEPSITELLPPHQDAWIQAIQTALHAVHRSTLGSALA
jgi:hypothetical protein